MRGHGLDKVARWRALLKLTVAERGNHQQLLVSQVRPRDRHGGKNAE